MMSDDQIHFPANLCEFISVRISHYKCPYLTSYRCNSDNKVVIQKTNKHTTPGTEKNSFPIHFEMNNSNLTLTWWDVLPV